MGSSTTGTEPSAPPQQADAPPAAEPDSRRRGRHGIIGRLLEAFGPTRPLPSDDTPPPGVIPLPLPAAHSLANLRKLRVDDVSVPKAEMVAVPLDISRDDLVEVFRKHGFSRVPVYKGTLDQPQGLILLKDLALTHGFGAGGRFSLKRLIRPVLYAPPSMPVGVLLQKMQRERVHMALVIDEYGGVDGLVTIEDLIETIIGEIDDEHDEVEGALWKEEGPGVFLAQAIAPLDEFEAAAGLRLRVTDDDEEIDTVGGLVFLRTGRVPARGEIVPHESGAEFEVLDADARRIKRLRMRLPGVKAAPATPAAEPAPAAEDAPAK